MRFLSFNISVAFFFFQMRREHIVSVILYFFMLNEPVRIHTEEGGAQEGDLCASSVCSETCVEPN